MANGGNKEIELPKSLQRMNILLAGSHPYINPLSMSAVIQYTINCYRARKKKSLDIPVVKLSITNMMNGLSCANIRSRLTEYGVSAQLFSIGPFKMEGVFPVLDCEYLVPKSQSWMADVILRWFEGANYLVTSSPIVDFKSGPSDKYASKSVPWKPWGVKAKPRSWDEFVSTMFIGPIFGQAYFSKQTQKEITEIRKLAGKVDKPKSQQTKKRKQTKKKQQSKLVEFLKS